MTSLQALWWLALPVLLLPILWHRQKRQRTASELLATARFLPSSAPQQMRVWRWTDIVLLVLRLLLLTALLAWLAVTIVPWRGDTVLADPSLDQAWVQKQVAAANMNAATTLPLPADVLAWLPHHEHEWRTGARLLVLARDGAVAMPATPPSSALAVVFRFAPAVAAKPADAVHRVVLATAAAHEDKWRALFAAFASTGQRYDIVQAPATGTELIVWDRPEAPPASWKAQHWWRANPPSGTKVRAGELTLAFADTPQGRVWTGMPWPPANADEALQLYDAWQALTAPSQPYALAAQAISPQRSGPLPLPGKTPADWLAWALVALFLLERLVAHARRR